MNAAAWFIVFQLKYWRLVFLVSATWVSLFQINGFAKADEGKTTTAKDPDSRSLSELNVAGFDPAASLRPVRGGKTWFEGFTFELGGAIEALTNRTALNFDVPRMALFFGVTQQIRAIWRGSFTLWLSDWEVNQNNWSFVSAFDTPFQRTSPLRFFSTIEAAPYYGSSVRLLSWPGWRYFRPSLFFGLGYLTFLQRRGWPVERGEELNGEVSARWGFGLRFVAPHLVAFSIKAEKWRGVKTFDYTGESLTLSLEFGDI